DSRPSFGNREGGRSSEGRSFGDRPARPAFNKEGGRGRADSRDSKPRFEDSEKKKIVHRQFSQNDSYNDNYSSANKDVRIHKLLAELGIGSRRNIEKLIEMGRVIVNGTRAIIGQRINLNDDVSVNGHRVNLQAKEWIKPRIIMYHKTSGEIVSHADPEGRPSVFDHLPRIRNGKWIAIGRLDFNTEGLLLFTNNGELANNFMHPRFGIEREYAVRVIGSLEEETREQLLKGILLDDGLASFGKIEDAGGENLNHWYRVTLSEGRNREVRRMFEAVGLTVSRLTRIRYGNLSLSSRLQRGKYQELSPEDVQLVLQSFDIQDIE
ncbi:MAG: Ribosomal large subunit pseudouridine synthase, partial [Pseudomonadota bacterium]